MLIPGASFLFGRWTKCETGLPFEFCNAVLGPLLYVFSSNLVFQVVELC